MKVSILIPCHNEAKSIKTCILSCINQSRKADQIVVVNDGSTDKSLSILSKFKEKIKIVNISNTSGRKSLAQAEGLKVVRGDILISTDGDTILDYDFVKRFYWEYLYGGIGGLEQFQALKTLQDAGFQCITPLIATRDRLISKWMNGTNAGDEVANQHLSDDNFLRLLSNTIEVLREQNKWGYEWRLDTFADNYIINYPTSDNPMQKYIVIDPVFVLPQLTDWAT